MNIQQKLFRVLIVILGITLLLFGVMFFLATSVAAQTSAPKDSAQGPDTYGPDLVDFPLGYNPLTGLPVSDPENLNLPAVLISITNFPASARPQAGPSFAPYIFEMYISEGMTRFLTIFYGDYPDPQAPISGHCPIRTDSFKTTGLILGNYVWHDGNGDGLQGYDEGPISGVCVNLYDGEANEFIDSTSTDSNGYFGFNVEADKKYYLKFVPPSGMDFTDPNLGNDDFADSDADRENGVTPIFSVEADDFSWDAGFIGVGNQAGVFGEGEVGEGSEGQTSSTEGDSIEQQTTQVENSTSNFEKPGEWIGTYIYDIIIGPIRSGRLPYKWVLEWFSKGCLIYAGKDSQVDIPGCASLYGTDETDINSAFLSIKSMKEIAKQNQVSGETIDYSGNIYLNLPSSSGKYSGSNLANIPSAGNANEVIVFYNFLNQAKWVFDPLSGGYLRHTDAADGTGKFYPATDRLNGRQLIFHNVIIMFARHEAITPTIIDINLNFNEGPAILFKDGKAYSIVWNTLSDEQAKETGHNRPVKFVDKDGNPVPLHPGQTWVHIVTYDTSAWEQSVGKWRVRFYAPPGTQ